MTDVSTVVLSALNGLRGQAPRPLMPAVRFYAEQDNAGPVDERAVVAALTNAEPNNPARIEFQLLISRCDGAQEEWAEGTPPHSKERRARIYDLLGFAADAHAAFDAEFPRDPGAVVIESADGDWRPWYTDQRRMQHQFYWDAYAGVLAAKPGWTPAAIGRLDAASTAVVRRLADPTWAERYQSKGLVVGYVQSGKTANFTGVIAKAIDAGYRLIIVLTGTVEMLRQQTQRRLDMELIGVENILEGKSEDDPAQMAATDYYTDQDWAAGKFLRHGVSFNNIDDVPAIRRLSTFDGDYKRLRQGLGTLDFRTGHELADRSRPVYDPANLFGTDVRIAVVKKNSAVLKRLVDDLGEIRANLSEIPALIIDDEADQASVNTKKQRKPTAEEKERTAINGRLAELLSKLGRAQYVGYTATPFANVFIDPDDSEDIFPKDFIVSLDRPDGYMGASDFHDLGGEIAFDTDGITRTFSNSNEKAHVRGLYANDDSRQRHTELQKALDSFVLAGAVKLYRRKLTGQSFRHHTMLVHESVRIADHAILADEIREIWHRCGYAAPIGLDRLRSLYDSDFAPVSRAIAARPSSAAEEMPMPAGFGELVTQGCISKALDLIERGTSPVIVVNGGGEKAYAQDVLDFQTDDVWKVLVGGAKLSRGFTVEGLTISYYTRRTQQADTLMQMGRWFGFRRGYRDLVRLFIGRNVPGPRHTHIDLYEAFEAVVGDEEDFREELRQYAAVNEETGAPQIRPEDVPPMVFQQLPWLKPTAANKMYNAELTTKGVGGKLVDFSKQPTPRDPEVNTRHFHCVMPLLERLDLEDEFRDHTTGNPYRASYGIIDARLVRDVVARFEWATPWWFTPHLQFLDEAIKKGAVTDFAVLLPRLSSTISLHVDGWDSRLPVLKRKRRPQRNDFSGSSPRQRAAIETVAGKRQSGLDGKATTLLDDGGGPKAVVLHSPTRGGLLLTLALDNGEPDADPRALPRDSILDSSDIATLFSWAMPYYAAPGGRVGFKTRRSDGGAIIDAEQ